MLSRSYIWSKNIISFTWFSTCFTIYTIISNSKLKRWFYKKKNKKQHSSSTWTNLNNLYLHWPCKIIFAQSVNRIKKNIKFDLVKYQCVSMIICIIIRMNSMVLTNPVNGFNSLIVTSSDLIIFISLTVSSFHSIWLLLRSNLF